MSDYIIGIDPGLVHTGVVFFKFEGHHLSTKSWVVEGMDVQRIQSICRPFPQAHVFIEAYKPRSHFGTDAKMVKGVAEIKNAIPNSKVILNTGVKKIITQDMMEVMDVWDFHVATHHQDLRSAARIGLFGAVKDLALNKVIYDYVTFVVDNT